MVSPAIDTRSDLQKNGSGDTRGQDVSVNQAHGTVLTSDYFARY